MKLIKITLFLTLYSIISSAQMNGKVIESKVLSSKILGKNVGYSIYLPPDYDINNSRKYPVLYLLHGYSDDETAWVQFGSVNKAADNAIKNGEISPMIIVMPNGELNWYVNSFDNKVRWMDMFTQEFMPTVEKEFKIREKKEFRAISGLSMGGYGAFMMCLKNPNLFGYCAGLSAALWTDQQVLKERSENYEQPFWPKGKKNDSEILDYFKKYNVIYLMKTMPIDTLNKVRWYFDCGDKDFVTQGNAYLHIALNEREITHEYRVRDGYHNWQYWKSHISDVLKFVSKGFERQ